MNTVVYTAGPVPGTRIAYDMQLNADGRTGTLRMNSWESKQRVSDEMHILARKELTRLYTSRAAAVGLSLSAYCTRFNVRLP